jgi:4-hydroxy-3-polyprenylbenzoate decarboxylase
MDVLDHSCSKLGFGGKMCIDGTKKFDEEKNDQIQDGITNSITHHTFHSLVDSLKVRFPEIHVINSDLVNKSIPILIMSIEKNKKGHIRELHAQLSKMVELNGIKIILYVEHTVNANDLPVALWRCCNNLDPKRDHIAGINSNMGCMGFDGTRKTKEFDDFHRDWPNVIVADDATIKAVDEKWNKLGLGSLIPSPSLKYKEQLYGVEAVVS